MLPSISLRATNKWLVKWWLADNHPLEVSSKGLSVTVAPTQFITMLIDLPVMMNSSLLSKSIRATRKNLPYLPITTELLKNVCSLFRPGPQDPSLSDLAWLRRHLDQHVFSLTYITHTVSEAMALDVTGDLLIASVQAWDALVCSSRPDTRVLANTILVSVAPGIIRRSKLALPLNAMLLDIDDTTALLKCVIDKGEITVEKLAKPTSLEELIPFYLTIG